MMNKPHAIIIGAGFTGCATAHDLALRGFEVTVVERGKIASGASGNIHGVLHSGARYCVDDRDLAMECFQESVILQRIATSWIEASGGLFIALDGNDLAYAETFLDGVHACRIPVEALTPQQALRLEPYINPRLKLAFSVPDGIFEPQQLVQAFADTARSNGATFRVFHEVRNLVVNGQGHVVGVQLWDHAADDQREVRGDIVINAAGAWVGEIAAMAGADVPIKPAPEVMVSFERRLLHRVVNRLSHPADGEMIVPQRRMMVVGSPIWTSNAHHHVADVEQQVEVMLKRGAALLPAIRHITQSNAYMSVRPSIVRRSASRNQARTFQCFDHRDGEGIDGFVTVAGGKATTCRAMAEKTADVVCAKLGVRSVCKTHEMPLIACRR